MKEFDRYSSAFAYGLVENGFSNGDKILLWVDSNNSAEALVAQMGAAKAGVAVVTFNEKDNCDAFHSALKDSGARGLVFSPNTQASQEHTRQDFLHKLMPELHSLYPGDELKLQNYPMLKQIIQTGHSNIRGCIKYKDSLVYATSEFAGFDLPQNDSSSQLFECYRDSRRVSTFTNGEIAEKSSDLWNNHFSKSAGDHTDAKMFNVEVRSGTTAQPVFMSVDIETPLGFATFLANSANHRKVFIPSTFNMSKILKSVHAQ